VSTADPTSLTVAPLGATQLMITRIGLGAWAMGGGDWAGGWGQQADAESVATIHRAVEHGINWIDTAPAYGFGRAEQVVGDALRRLPRTERPVVFTKCGLVWDDGERALRNDLSPTSIRRECEASLRRLQVDTIDLLQAHWPTWDDTPLEESWKAMAELVDAGKVRHIGLSNFTLADLQRCEAIRHVDTYQPQLNLLERDAVAALPWCAERGVGVIVYSPMRSGLLSGRFSRERANSLPEDDWRHSSPDFCEPQLSSNLSLVDGLRPLAAALGVSVAALCIAWTLSWPGVTGAIVGARSPAQLDDWVRAGELTLDPLTLDSVADLLAASGAGVGPTSATSNHG
jgi:aryl-alcohol dehydrogenase-like predicted oxidoreductase